MMNEKFKALKPPFKYDEYCQAILNRENHRVLDLRGWGFIQKLPNPEKVQDDFGNELVRLMNTSHDSEEVERLNIAIDNCHDAMIDKGEEIQRLRDKNKELQYVIDCLRNEAYGS